MNNNKVVEAINIKKSYYTSKGVYTEVLKDLNVTVNKKEMTAIMGPSGVGKSTLLHLLGSLDYPEEGIINLYTDEQKINYTEISSDRLAKIRNNKIGFVFQFSHLLPEFTALENVMIPALIAGKSQADAKSKAEELLRLVEVEHRANHKPQELSGGEQQRVAIARAIINNPLIVLADEPTGNLDSKNASAVLNLLNNLKFNHNITVVLATHSNEVAALADRILIMGDGKIVDEIKK